MSCRSFIIVATACASARQLAIAQDKSLPEFHRDIAPIVLQNCHSCHRPGGPAPFSLQSYDDVSKRGKQIAIVTQSRYMPPWLPAVGDGLPHLSGVRRLSDEQIDLIRRWVRDGAPEGDPQRSIAPPQTQPADWPLGPPDLVLPLSEPFELPAEGLDVVRTFVFRNDTMDDAFITAIDIRCSNPQAIHHASFLVDQTRQARLVDDADPGPGYASMGDLGFNLAGSGGVWSIGASGAAGARLNDLSLPRAVARPLPADTDLVAEMHFKPTGKPEKLDIAIGLYLTAEQVQRFPIPITVGTFFIEIAAGEKGHVVRDSFELPADAHVVGIAPRAHYICRTVKVTATEPGKQAATLLQIDDWDFNWMQEYRFASPLCLPAGTRIDVEFTYDNSADNPRNPSVPPKPVRDGFRPIDEMGLAFVYVIPEQRGDHATLEQARSAKLVEMMQFAKTRRAQGGGATPSRRPSRDPSDGASAPRR